MLLVAAALPARADAALVNATAAHALDYDDTGLDGHPSVVLAPAVLAEGERTARPLDRHAEAAYVVGYEVWAELIARDADKHHGKGWHPTAVFGAVAAAGAVCALRGLDAGRACNALGIAASLASGLIANFGTMTKPFQVGHAAASGIDAADLAQAGMTASPDALEHQAGFLAAISPRGRVDRGPCAQPPGQNLRIASLGLGVKKYPMCFATHRVIDAMLDLVRAHNLQPAEVASVHATIGTTQDGMLRNRRPANALEAKFSLEFAVAASLVARKVGLAELTDAFVAQPQVQALFSRVYVTTVDTVCPEEPTLAVSDRVRIRTRDEHLIDSGEVFHTRGGIGTPPLPQDELRAKFLDCVNGVAWADGAALFDSLTHLDALGDVADLG